MSRRVDSDFIANYGATEMLRRRKTAGARWYATPLGGLASLLSGCDPILDIDGAFFPAWIVSLALGSAGAVVARIFFVRWEIEEHLRPLPLVYGSLALSITLSLWLIFYRT